MCSICYSLWCAVLVKRKCMFCIAANFIEIHSSRRFLCVKLCCSILFSSAMPAQYTRPSHIKWRQPRYMLVIHRLNSIVEPKNCVQIYASVSKCKSCSHMYIMRIQHNQLGTSVPNVKYRMLFYLFISLRLILISVERKSSKRAFAACFPLLIANKNLYFQKWYTTFLWQCLSVYESLCTCLPFCSYSFFFLFSK